MTQGIKTENWDDYRFFLAVAQTGSLSGAARALNVAQPTVGRRIDQLEQRHGAHLFTSTPDGMQLTALGKEILPTVLEIERASFSVMNKISGQDLNLNGVITITSTQSFTSNWLAKRIATFSDLYPNILVRCIADTRKRNLVKREADIAIRFGVPASSDLIGTRICDLHCGIYGSSDYFDRFGEPESLSDLVDHKVIGPAGGYRSLSPDIAIHQNGWRLGKYFL